MCKRPNSALIGSEKKKPRHIQSEIAMSTQLLKQDRMRQQMSTAAQDSGAHVFNDFSRITAPSSIFFFTDRIRKPFPIEWCKELPPHDRSFGYRRLSTLNQLKIHERITDHGPTDQHSGILSKKKKMKKKKRKGRQRKRR